MTKTVFAAALLFALQAKGNPDFKYDERAGMSVQKFPKNDEWDFKEMGKFLKSPKIVVSHKVDELMIEVMSVPPQPNTSGWDLKKQMDVDYSGFSSSPGITECKQVAMQASKLPNGGGGNANAMFFQATFKLMDTPSEIREWAFVGKENQWLYLVVVSGAEGNYKKHQKIVEFILGNIKTYKIPK